MSLLHELGEAAFQVTHAGEVYQEMEEEHGGAGTICGLNLCLLSVGAVAPVGHHGTAQVSVLWLLFGGWKKTSLGDHAPWPAR